MGGNKSREHLVQRYMLVVSISIKRKRRRTGHSKKYTGDKVTEARISFQQPTRNFKIVRWHTRAISIVLLIDLNWVELAPWALDSILFSCFHFFDLHSFHLLFALSLTHFSIHCTNKAYPLNNNCYYGYWETQTTIHSADATRCCCWRYGVHMHIDE